MFKQCTKQDNCNRTMNLKLILVFGGVSFLLFGGALFLLFGGVLKVYLNNLTNDELCKSYYPEDDNGELMNKLQFIKLNTSLLENQEISKSLGEINARQEEQQISINKLVENYQSLQQSNEWTVIQRRQDGSVDFNVTWDMYKNGFGNSNGEFFIGLEKLYKMTTSGAPQELRIIVKDFDDHEHYAIYDEFAIGNESEQYALKTLGLYSGDAGDGLWWHKGQKFSTKDNGKCAVWYNGGWWFREDGISNHCFHSNLNGPYNRGTYPSGGVSWGNGPYKWTYSLKFVEMMIRSKV